MSGRGGGRGGRGGGRGRGRGGFGSFGGPSLPPGVDFRDIQASMAAPSAQYPAMDIPVMTPLTGTESKAVTYQIELIDRLRVSKYWILEEEAKKTNEIERWFDRVREKEKLDTRALKPEDLNPEFFPTSLWDGYFNPAKKQRVVEPKKQRRKRKLDIDALGGDEKDGEGGANDEDVEGEDDEERQEDYDVEDLEGDDDYEANYFDNGEADDDDDMNDDGDRGGGDYD